MRNICLFLAATLSIAWTPTAFAQPRHRHHVYRPIYPYGGQSDIIGEATARAQREPGLAQEIDPGSQQTATGGPVGGLRTPF